MEEKILIACKIISNAYSDFGVYEWHKACIKIMDLGLNTSSLNLYINHSSQDSEGFSGLERGNYCSAANYIKSFIGWDPTKMVLLESFRDGIDLFIRFNMDKGD